jgi:hypothetical protein
VKQSNGEVEWRSPRYASIMILNPGVDAGHGGNLRPGLQP